MLRISRLLKEPLVHFLAGGALLFALDAWTGPDAEGPAYDLHVGPGHIERLRQAWAAQSGRPPSEVELEALIEDYVREEIFYREAVRRGLDEGDVMVRRRLAQKLAFLVEDLALVDGPDEEELRRFYEEHAERYAEGARISFRHVFFSRDRRADPAGDAAAALEVVRASATAAERRGAGTVAAGTELASTRRGAPAAGDPFMLHSEYAGRTHQEVRELFGIEFADAVFALEGGGWQGPVRSSYGEHLVAIVGSSEARVPPFEEVREAVVRDVRQARREDANREAYREMRSRYRVVVGDPTASGTDRAESGETAG